jgi:hypothetical protein
MKQSIKLALDNGIPRRETHPGGMSILHEAIAANQTDIVEYLLSPEMAEVVPNINYQWEDVRGGVTPLQYALFLGSEPVVRQLFDHGADSTKPTLDGMSSVWYWTHGKFPDHTILRKLHSDLRGVASYMEHGDVATFTALVSSCRFDAATEVLEFSGGKEVNAPMWDNPGITTLARIVHGLTDNFKPALEYLIYPPHRYGAAEVLVDPGRKSNAFHYLFQGHLTRIQTPHYRNSKNLEPVVEALKVLLRRFPYPLEINREDIFGHTPLFLGTCVSSLESVELLLEHDAGVNTVSLARGYRIGPTALDIVRMKLRKGRFTQALDRFWAFIGDFKEYHLVCNQSERENLVLIERLLLQHGGQTMVAMSVSRWRTWWSGLWRSVFGSRTRD